MRADNVVGEHEAVWDHDVYNEAELRESFYRKNRVVDYLASCRSRAEAITRFDQRGLLQLEFAIDVSHYHHVVLGRSDAFSALQRDFNQLVDHVLVLCHEDNWLLSDSSVCTYR